MELLIAFLTMFTRIVILSLSLYKALEFLNPQASWCPNLSYFASLGWASAIIIGYNLVIYPRFLDPLRKYPVVDISDSRILFPVTDVPRGEHALEWTKQYPGYDALRVRVRCVTTLLVPLSANAFRDILSTHQQDFVKPLSGRNYLSRVLGYGLILSEGDRHARQRKQLTPHFRIQSIRALHGLMLAKTKLLLQKMEQESEQLGKVEVCNWASKATLDIIGVTLMSKDFNSVEVHFQPENDAFAQLTAPSSGQTFLFGLSLMLPKCIVSALPTKTNRMVWNNTSRLRERCKIALSDLYGRGKNFGGGIKDGILSSIIQDTSISHEEIIDQMLTFLGAGHETTATSIAWVVHLLTLPENREYQASLRNEITSNYQCTESPNELEKLPWLNAICEETLRLFPPVTTTARKAIRDTIIANTRLPKNTMVIIFPWATNRNPQFWGGADSERFVPERWIDTLPDGRLRMNKHGGAQSNFCELTFLHGNRSCIGKDFAKAELRCIVAKMFGEYIVERLPGDDGQITPAGSITIKPADGLFVKLTRI